MAFLVDKSKVFYALSMITLFLLFAYHSDRVFEKSIFDDVSITKYFDSKNLSDFKSSTALASNANFSTSTASTDSTCGYFVRDFLVGRLGNQMFMYASFYGMVKKRENIGNKSAFMRVPPSLDRIFENLSIPQKTLPDSWFKSKNFTNRGESKCCAYQNTSFDREVSCNGENVLVKGYRQSYRYFDHVVEEIKKEFTFKKSIRDKSRLLVDESLAEKQRSRNNCVVVGVHLRQGDFANNSSLKLGYIPARVDYLNRSIRFHEDLHLNNDTKKIDCLAFLIFGNSYEWNLEASKKVELLRPNNSYLILVNSSRTSAEIDMCALGSCDHAIISTGSFSWWAGFFSPGIVTYQKEYAKPNSLIYSQIEPKDYFLPNWIPL